MVVGFVMSVGFRIDGGEGERGCKKVRNDLEKRERGSGPCADILFVNEKSFVAYRMISCTVVMRRKLSHRTIGEA